MKNDLFLRQFRLWSIRRSFVRPSWEGKLENVWNAVFRAFAPDFRPIYVSEFYLFLSVTKSAIMLPFTKRVGTINTQ